MKTTLTILAFSLIALVHRPASAGFFTGLGFLPDGISQSTAQDVSADGTTVVGISNINSDFGEAFRWTQAEGLVGLGDLPGGIFKSEGVGVSADGSVIVGRANAHGAAFNDAFRWTSSGMVGIGDLTGGTFNSLAFSVSGDGSIVVGIGRSASGREAFRWTEVTGITGLGDLPGGLFDSLASNMSLDGSTIVGFGNSVQGQEAVRWTSSGIEGLGDFDGGAYESRANGVSGDGSVIAGWGTTATGFEAFRWTEASGMTGLGILPGTNISFAHDVSADGTTIVGQAGLTISNQETAAFIWDEVNGMRNLQDVLTSQGNDLTGWTLLSARGVSEDGRVIVGHGVNPNGQIEAFYAQLDSTSAVPEPSSLALLGMGVLSLFAFGLLGETGACERPAGKSERGGTFEDRSAAGCGVAHGGPQVRPTIGGQSHV